MIHWSEQYTTGSGDLDHQHRTLIDKINGLEAMLAISYPTRADYESMIKVVDFMEFYAHAHFKAEEVCMEAYRCPAHAQNKQAHAEFLKFFREFKEHNRTKGFPREIVEQLHAVTSRWIEEHILLVDTQLKACMKG
ncbi:MAG: hemerythrin domain-containing protein [Verrucomicrobiae bacterium]|nr:hemerythrin domain-containing protein [Verrucomicrobiae bacterium]